MKDVWLTRTSTDEANFERLEMVQRIYRYYIDASNYEAVEARDTSEGDKHLTWRALGVGSLRQPVGTIVNGEIIVSWVPNWTLYFSEGEQTCLVKGGASLPVRFEEE